MNTTIYVYEGLIVNRSGESWVRLGVFSSLEPLSKTCAQLVASVRGIVETRTRELTLQTAGVNANEVETLPDPIEHSAEAIGLG